jgi:L-iditol 2-dehydrogenase
VRAVQYDLAGDFPASLVDVDEPALPNGEWARIAVTTGGICGSDLHLFSKVTGPSPTLGAYSRAFPFVLGHEIAGTVVEAGADCSVAVGTRVAVQPTITCEMRGIDPPCRFCAAGHQASCLNLDRDGDVAASFALGFSRGLGGGWAEQCVAHRTQLFPVPDAVPDRAASLHEPVSIAVHGLLRQPPRNGDAVLVVGAGIIGLATVAALRALFPACAVTVVARHDHQATAAIACGATEVVRPEDDRSHFGALAQASGARVVGRKHELMLNGGFPYVVEAVGVARSVTDALRAVDNRGTVLLLGAAGVTEVDLSPVWWKEAALVGAINHSWDAGPGGEIGHSVARALDILAAGGLPDEVVVTHEFALADYREAIATALDRGGANAIKVVFRPQD